jgi:CheY-like chemotaxis protein
LQVGEFQVKRKEIELSSICESLVKEFTVPAKFKSLELSFQNNCGDTRIIADEYSITFAISNLIDNAIKYTDKGFIEVILRRGNNDVIILDVKDTGIGISNEFLDKIFEPFQQEQMGYGRAYEGVGLGLSLVNKVAALNNANVIVESKKGIGSTFSIIFSKGILVEKQVETDFIAAASVPHEKLGIKSVLIVEDDIINQMAMEMVLQKKYDVFVAVSANGAMEILNKNKVDIILMDISIKGKKNGLELTKDLKGTKTFAHIPVIVITAHAYEIDKQNAFAAGCDDFLPKPFPFERLFDVIARFDKRKIN